VRRLAAAVGVMLLAMSAAAAPVRSLGRVPTGDGGSVEVGLNTAANVEYIQTHERTVRVSTLVPPEAQALAEAMHDLVRIVDGRASPARVLAAYTWPDFIARNRLPPGAEIRLAAERRGNGILVYSVELALPGARATPAELTPRDWAELASLLSRAARR
jgi:hypothetical protein